MSRLAPSPCRAPQVGAFLIEELSAYPGRINTVSRCLLTSALVILISMALQVPWLSLSLIVVFYVTQSNVVITRLVGLMFIVGANMAIALSILLLKFTIDYPLIRILVAGSVFFCAVYLMRITKSSLVFFIVAIVIIYAQTFVDLTDQGELITRLVLWAWAAVNYAIVLALLVNTVFLPQEPAALLKKELRHQLRIVANRLQTSKGRVRTSVRIGKAELHRGVLALQKLLRLATMRDQACRMDQARHLACIATVSRIYGEADGLLAVDLRNTDDVLPALRAACLKLDAAIASNRPFDFRMPEKAERINVHRLAGPAAVVYQALKSFSDRNRSPDVTSDELRNERFVASDALTNPVYVQFALKALLSAIIGYVIYNGTQWIGIHTIMLTTVIMAQPSLGATSQRGLLRFIGALVGSFLALCVVVFVFPRLDSVVGLLAITLPVLALSAWIAAGSERSSYIGIQIMFTFSLAALSEFGPTTDLTEIRDRVVGILMGIGISMLIHTLLWPESESGSLRRNLSNVLHGLSGLLRTTLAIEQEGHSAMTQKFLHCWEKVGDCQVRLARVALEPNWCPAEGQHEQTILLAQNVLAQSIEILVAIDGFQSELLLLAKQLPQEACEAIDAVQLELSRQLDRYAQNLAHEPPEAVALPRVCLNRLAMVCANYTDEYMGDEFRQRFRIFDKAKILTQCLSELPHWTATTLESEVTQMITQS